MVNDAKYIIESFLKEVGVRGQVYFRYGRRDQSQTHVG